MQRIDSIYSLLFMFTLSIWYFIILLVLYNEAGKACEFDRLYISFDTE